MLEVKETDIGDVQPYSQNPRVIPEKAVKAVAESIEKFGFQQPIVCDNSGVVAVSYTHLTLPTILLV